MKLQDAYSHRVRLGYRRFYLPDKLTYDAGILRCLLEFQLEPPADHAMLIQYEAMLQTELLIEHLVADPVNSRHLEKLFQEINWNAPAFTKGYLLQYGQLDETLEARLGIILKAMEQLMAAGEEGRTISERLQLKYWYDSSFNREYLDGGNLEELCRKYFPSRTFTRGQGLVPVDKAYDLLIPRRGGHPSTAKRDKPGARKTLQARKG